MFEAYFIHSSGNRVFDYKIKMDCANSAKEYIRLYSISKNFKKGLLVHLKDSSGVLVARGTTLETGEIKWYDQTKESILNGTK